jgi:hypothetical protein
MKLQKYITEATNHLDLINDQFLNNEDATDQELYQLFVDAGISPARANEAIALRSAFFTDPFAAIEYTDGQLQIKQSPYAL